MSRNLTKIKAGSHHWRLSPRAALSGIKKQPLGLRDGIKQSGRNGSASRQARRDVVFVNC